MNPFYPPIWMPKSMFDGQIHHFFYGPSCFCRAIMLSTVPHSLCAALGAVRQPIPQQQTELRGNHDSSALAWWANISDQGVRLKASNQETKTKSAGLTNQVGYHGLPWFTMVFTMVYHDLPWFTCLTSNQVGGSSKRVQQQSGDKKNSGGVTDADQSNPNWWFEARSISILMWICCQQHQWQFVTTKNKASLNTRLVFELEQQHVYFTRQKTIHRLKLLWDWSEVDDLMFSVCTFLVT